MAKKVRHPTTFHTSSFQQQRHQVDRMEQAINEGNVKEAPVLTMVWAVVIWVGGLETLIFEARFSSCIPSPSWICLGNAAVLAVDAVPAAFSTSCLHLLHFILPRSPVLVLLFSTLSMFRFHFPPIFSRKYLLCF